ncbi:uncharacterized protein GGS25DRAFT_525476 [Hypoxylon fragiforme]|uniref:uncharacterized protein n=1 Tax=Hypoxylon fragiforme TaxID=63214 RepID=UPI0020C602CF|nr:uncharacterized protein GGS25DRAFT_525476 [Hypoxylon fragiforme]KAI2604199.1 hypothetical protein GGS25DRAFT_525476 [Hypoxylon fragiforme]
MAKHLSSFNGRQMLKNARSKLGGLPSKRLKGLIKKFSIRSHKYRHDEGGSSTDPADNDDQSSLGIPPTPAPTPADLLIPSNSNENVSRLVRKAGRVSSTGYQPKQGGAGLLSLPQELFDHITSYLGYAHIGVLALVNKELMARFLRSCERLDPLDTEEQSPYKLLGRFIKRAPIPRAKVRGTLLSLVDYDMEDIVYCYKCKKLHDPFLAFRDRAYAPHKAARCSDWSMDHHMPSRATRKLLRTITKRRLHGAEYRYLMQQVNNTATFYQKGILVQISLRMRYRNDDMILRRQQIISSTIKSSLAMWLFSQQVLDPQPASSSFLTLPKVYPACYHKSWGTVYSSLIHQLINPHCTQDHGDEEIPQHSPECFGSFKGDNNFDASKQEGHMIHERLKWQSSPTPRNPMDVPAPLGDVLSCSNCTTDFSLDVVALPEPFGWGFVLTTWIDLGRLDFCSKWDSHRDGRPLRHYLRKHVHGDICTRFEDLSTRLDHQPRISEINLDRMHPVEWAERAARGQGLYSGWSSAHSCNPATGWIEDPDPLEEADY